MKPGRTQPGGKFRLLFQTSSHRNAASSDIDVYNQFVQSQAANGHVLIRPYSEYFKVLGSTATVDARDNTMTTGTGVQINWVGVSAPKVADDYTDFYDGSWDNQQWRDQNGNVGANRDVYTGSNNDGTKHSPDPLGSGANVRYGRAGPTAMSSRYSPFDHGWHSQQTRRYFYALSPVFLVDPAPPPVSVEFPKTGQEGSHQYDYNVREGSLLQPTLKFNLETTEPANLTIIVTPGTATAGVDFPAGPYTVSVPVGVTKHRFSIPIPSDTDLEDYETFTLTIEADSMPDGYKLRTGGQAVSQVQIVNVAVVPALWSLTPPGLGPGDQFRLLFKTGNERDITDSEIAEYDAFVRARTDEHPWHEDIEPYASTFRTVGSTAMVDANWHTATGVTYLGISHTPWHAPIYWLGGERISNSHPGIKNNPDNHHNRFWFGQWGIANSPANQRHADGLPATTTTGAITGSVVCCAANGNVTHKAGIAPDASYLGGTAGLANRGSGNRYGNALNLLTGQTRVSSGPFFAMSAVFEVEDHTPVSVSESEGNRDLPILHTTQGRNSYSFSYRIDNDETTAEYGTDYSIRSGYIRGNNRGTVTVPAGTPTARLPLQINDDKIVEGKEYIVLEVTSGARMGHKIIITLRDNEFNNLLTVDEQGATLTEGLDGQDERDISVTLKHRQSPWGVNPRLPVDAPFEYCIEGDAALGDDYELVKPDNSKVAEAGCHVATMPKGQTSLRLFTVKVIDDGVTDDTEKQVKIRLRRVNQHDLQTPIPLTVPASSRIPDETISTVITIKDDLPMLEVSGPNAPINHGQIAFNVKSVNGALADYVRIAWSVDDLSNVIRDRYLGKSGYYWLQRGSSGYAVTVEVRRGAGDGHAVFKLAEGKYRIQGTGKACVAVNNGSCPGSGAPPIQIPETQVANLSVSAVDDASATATWDAVPHATSYQVEYTGNAVDPDSTAFVSDFISGHIGTSWTFQHNSAESMSITVTVTPEYIDGGGVRQQVFNLASSADLDVVIATTTTCTPNLPSDAVTVSEVTGWRDAHSGAAHVLRWNRVLEALGEDTGSGATPLTAAESKANESQFMASRWNRVTRTLEAIEACDDGGASDDTTVVPPPTPEVSIASDGDITEGGSATYTLTASPAPTSALDVDVTVAQSGDFGVTPGSQTVTIGTSGSGTLTIATSDDSVDEPDGSVTATVTDGADYDVSATAGAATVAVSDDDATAPPSCTPNLPSDAVTVSEVTGWRDGHPGAAHILRWNQVLEALGEDTGSDATALTAAESKANESQFMASRWNRVTRTLEAIEQCDDSGSTTTTVVPPPPPADPVISIASDGDITEGGSATFTLTSSPAPAGSLIITINVTQSGDFGVTTGSRTVTLSSSGTGTLSVVTSDDSVDEADGSVTATVTDGTDYDVSSTNGAATVAVSDDDTTVIVPPPPPPPTPEVSIASDGDITEGGNATFTVTANPAPTSALSVTVSVTQSGDFGVTTGSRTVTIGTGGTGTLSVATSDDSVDEPDGSVTATIANGSGYDVSSTAGAASAVVSDDDATVVVPPATVTNPTISASDASAREDAGTMTFTVTLSGPSANVIKVQYSVGLGSARRDSDFEGIYATLTFQPGETSKTVDITLIDDDLVEGEEKFGFWLSYARGGATIPDNHSEGTIIDDD